MKISVPKNLSDCTPEQLSKWIFLSGGGINIETLSQSLDFKVQVVAIFSNVSKPKLYNSDVETINNAFNHLLNVLTEEGSELIGEVTIDGQRYVFDKVFEHKTTGLIIDIKLIESVYESPYEVLAMLYIEEGMKYNQIDENDKILNVFAFFLHRWEQLKDAMYALNTATTMTTMKNVKNELKNELTILNGSTGRETSSS